MIEIDGSYLEGGGQIIRTAVSLSIITQKPFKVFNIRAKRDMPGLKYQHLFAINALKELTNSEVLGNELKSTELVFKPKVITKQKTTIKIPTSGSISLVLQALLPSCVLSDKETELHFLGGGTTGKGSPTLEYVKNVLIPNLKLFGVIPPEIEIIQAGYYPKGNAEVKVRIFPSKLKKIDLSEFKGIKKINCISEAARILEKAKVAERQKIEFQKKFIDFNAEGKSIYYDSLSPGSAITGFAETNSGSVLGADALGVLGKKSEIVGSECADWLNDEIKSESNIDYRCADQLIPFLALIGGKIKTSKISKHLKTNIWVCNKFLDSKFEIKEGIVSCRTK